jgi:hypothetical protein
VIPGNEFAKQLTAALEAADIEWRIYSGRGMCGKCCVGVPTGGSYSMGEIRHAVREVEDVFELEQVDSLGLGEIVYWPSAELVVDTNAYRVNQGR